MTNVNDTLQPRIFLKKITQTKGFSIARKVTVFVKREL
jgi:hypothetical protein